MTQKKLLNILSIVFLGAFLAFIYEAAKPQSTASNDQPFLVKQEKKYSGSARVIDGDSIVVNGNETRLIGIDAPEFKQNCFKDNRLEYACGQMSYKFLLNLIGANEVTCYYEIKDKYNRFLGECFVGDLSINQELLKNGMAVIYSFNNANNNMILLENHAKENKLGLWQGSFQMPKDYRKYHKRKN